MMTGNPRLDKHVCTINYKKYCVSGISIYELPMKERILLIDSYMNSDKLRRFKEKYYFLYEIIELEMNEEDIANSNKRKILEEDKKAKRTTTSIKKDYSSKIQDSRKKLNTMINDYFKSYERHRINADPL